MDGREAMAMSSGSGTPRYLIHKGRISGGGGGSGSGTLHGHHSTLNSSAPVFRPLASSHHLQASQLSIHKTLPGQSFAVDSPPHADVSHGTSIGTVSMVQPSVRKKRGRPRKYGHDGNGKMALGLLPMSNTPSGSQPGSTALFSKRARGRPRGSGRKQRLASVGEWMNESAGMAFAPHVIRIRSGEDIAAKILSFSQQRPRAVCVLSGSGTVSLVTFKHPSSSNGNITYEGRFEILCLSGSYLLAEEGGPHNRTGGISVSLSSPDGHLIGGSVAMLIASGPVQVVVGSFLYGCSSKPKEEVKQIAAAAPEPEKADSKPPCSGGSIPFATSMPRHSSSSAVAAMWPSSQPLDLKHLHADIDLMRG